MPGSLPAMTVPPGKVIFTAGPLNEACSVSRSRHIRGFFALATLPVCR